MRNSTDPPLVAHDLMTTDLVTLSENDTVADARDRMLVGAINSILIVGESGALVGIVTSHDLVDDFEPEVRLGDMMSSTVFTIDRSATIAEAAQSMRQELVHHLVVTEEGTAVGVVSTFDLLDVLAR